jgi:hypothetical protein
MGYKGDGNSKGNGKGDREGNGRGDGTSKEKAGPSWQRPSY